ncbi:hypothetical protein [uncultured Mediterranean phage uvMED]|nr:hypothetical protein [uncultured Mediterranean phage uvMED]
MEVKGKVKKVFEVKTFDSGFTKREMILTTEEQYPQHISIEFLKGSVDLLNDLHEGESVNVHINLRGREWTNSEGVTRYFNSIVGWRLEKVNSEYTKKVRNSNAGNDSKGTNFDDLPF